MKTRPAKVECIIFIFVLFSIAVVQGITSMSKSDACPDIEDRIEVKYELVESHRNDRVRFAAFSRSGGNTKKQEEWKQLSILQWAKLLSSKNDRARQLSHELTQVIVKACPSYGAFFFETKGCSSLNASEKQFEFVLVKAPSRLQRAEKNPDVNAFKEYLNGSSNTSKKTTACSFWNLGKNAKLVAPRPQDGKPLEIYSHLAPFLRGGSKEEIVQIWGLVVDEYLNVMQEWGKEPIWLSTSGLGVSWLHFRLDHRPKYYTFTEFALEK